jgi:putative redox protein
MKVLIKQIDGLALAAKGESNHWITMDAPDDVGGHGAGSRPMQVMLVGMGGCAAMDVLSILMKRRLDVRSYEMEIDADMTEEHPRVFTKIVLTHKITGKGIKPADVERAIDLTDKKYCGALTMIKCAAEVQHRYEIVDSQ